MDSWHLDILALLALMVLAYIGLLIIVRRRLPGDYTAVKVIIGVALCLCASYAIARDEGVGFWLLVRIAVLPVAVGGAIISAWQLYEWARRLWRRHEKRLSLLEETRRDA